MRILGIDYGDSKVGISVSDPFGWTAQGVCTINWKGNPAILFDRIKSLVKEYNIEKIVVGFPRNTNGSLGQRAEKTLRFVEKLQNMFDIEVIKRDEWYTTQSARNTMTEMGVKNSKKYSLEDKMAAVFILQGYLDNIRNKSQED